MTTDQITDKIEQVKTEAKQKAAQAHYDMLVQNAEIKLNLAYVQNEMTLSNEASSEAYIHAAASFNRFMYRDFSINITDKKLSLGNPTAPLFEALGNALNPST